MSPNPKTFSVLTEEYLLFARAELRFSPETLVKYRDCLKQITRIIGDLEVVSLSKADVLRLRTDLVDRNLSVARQVSILLALKGFLNYVRHEAGIDAFDPAEIRIPRRPRTEVAYLTAAEVERFVNSIQLASSRGRGAVVGLRFRALVETILGSAMRISEVLSLNKIDIHFEHKEARIVGKGRKQRTVFFTDRALHWLKEYWQVRRDNHPAAFVTIDGSARLSRDDIWRPFKDYERRSGIAKRVTPHLLRHTAATHLLFNGCPVGHIKEILGHERLETTCRYYLGLDHRAAKAAHQLFLRYGDSGASADTTHSFTANK